jgi:hypothetical protein
MVAEQIIVVVRKHQGHWFCDIPLLIPAVLLIPMLIPVKVEKRGFFLLLERMFQRLHRIIDLLIGVLPDMESALIALEQLPAVEAAKGG